MARRRIPLAFTCVGVCVALVACSTDSGVSVDRAEPLIDDTTAVTDAPAPTPTLDDDAGTDASTDTVPPMTLPGTSLPPAPTPPAPPATDEGATPSPPAGDLDGVGDVLFPSLGNPGVDVQDYDVALTYDPDADTIEGSVTLTVAFTEDRKEFTLDSVDLDVSAVTVDGAPAEFTAEDVELRIQPPDVITAGTTAEVVVDYSGAPDAEASMAGIPNGWFHTDGGSYVLNEPDGARTWVPSNDHPSDKATWTFEITVPSGVTAVANGSLVSTTEGADGDTWVWRQSEPMATYLVQLITGDYQLVEATGPGGLPLVSAVLRDDVKLMAPFTDTIAEQIEFFEQWFGPYPLDRYGISMTDSFSGLAMETQGRSLFSRDDFLSGELGYWESLLLSHELAHQWFGDAVTPAVWGDIWLNEGFATYGEWLWLDHVGMQPLEDEAAAALEQRNAMGGHSTGEPTVDDLFGFTSYQGGAVVLHALRATIGDQAFWELLQQWVVQNDGTSRTTDDFITLAEDVAKTDLTEFFEDWLYAERLPSSFPD